MKKKKLQQGTGSLTACLLIVIALAFSGCKDDKEIYKLPSEKAYYGNTKNEIGTFLYSEKEKTWIIVSDSVITLPNDTLPERAIIYEIIDNADIDDQTREEYSSFIGEKVIFSGKYMILGGES